MRRRLDVVLLLLLVAIASCIDDVDDLVRPDVTHLKKSLECKVKDGILPEDCVSKEVPCSGHGVRSGEGKCVCASYYEGSDCSVFVGKSGAANRTMSDYDVDWKTGFVNGIELGLKRKKQMDYYRMLRDNYGLVDGELPCLNGCSGNGWCNDGLCVCNPPFEQPDCSRIHPSSPNSIYNASWQRGFGDAAVFKLGGVLANAKDNSAEENADEARGAAALKFDTQVSAGFDAGFQTGMSPVGSREIGFNGLDCLSRMTMLCKDPMLNYDEELRPLMLAWKNSGNLFKSIRDLFDRSMIYVDAGSLSKAAFEQRLLTEIDLRCDQKRLRNFEARITKFKAMQEAGLLTDGLKGVLGSFRLHGTDGVKDDDDDGSDDYLDDQQGGVGSAQAPSHGHTQVSAAGSRRRQNVLAQIESNVPVTGDMGDEQHEAFPILSGDAGEDEFMSFLELSSSAAEVVNCPDTCSGHGLCRADRCICFTGYKGVRCEDELTDAEILALEAKTRGPDTDETPGLAGGLRKVHTCEPIEFADGVEAGESDTLSACTEGLQLSDGADACCLRCQQGYVATPAGANGACGARMVCHDGLDLPQVEPAGFVCKPEPRCSSFSLKQTQLVPDTENAVTPGCNLHPDTDIVEELLAGTSCALKCEGTGTEGSVLLKCEPSISGGESPKLDPSDFDVACKDARLNDGASDGDDDQKACYDFKNDLSVATGSCSECSGPDRDECSSASCADGYHTYAAGKCSQCSIDACTENQYYSEIACGGENGDGCISCGDHCPEGSYQKGDCGPQASGCAQCHDGQCAEGETFVKSACGGQSSGCVACGPTNCEDGQFYLADECDRQSDGCRDCSASGSTCKAGEYLLCGPGIHASDVQCKDCSASRCGSDSSVAEEGTTVTFTYDESTCQGTFNGCTSCNSVVCKTGWYQEVGACSLDDNGCRRCNTPGLCPQDGHYFDCGARECRACDSSTCEAGQTFFSDACELDNNGCTSCSASNCVGKFYRSELCNRNNPGCVPCSKDNCGPGQVFDAAKCEQGRGKHNGCVEAADAFESEKRSKAEEASAKVAARRAARDALRRSSSFKVAMQLVLSSRLLTQSESLQASADLAAGLGLEPEQVKVVSTHRSGGTMQSAMRRQHKSSMALNQNGALSPINQDDEKELGYLTNVEISGFATFDGAREAAERLGTRDKVVNLLTSSSTSALVSAASTPVAIEGHEKLIEATVQSKHEYDFFYECHGINGAKLQVSGSQGFISSVRNKVMSLPSQAATVRLTPSFSFFKITLGDLQGADALGTFMDDQTPVVVMNTSLRDVYVSVHEKHHSYLDAAFELNFGRKPRPPPNLGALYPKNSTKLRALQLVSYVDGLGEYGQGYELDVATTGTIAFLDDGGAQATLDKLTGSLAGATLVRHDETVPADTAVEVRVTRSAHVFVATEGGNATKWTVPLPNAGFVLLPDEHVETHCANALENGCKTFTKVFGKSVDAGFSIKLPPTAGDASFLVLAVDASTSSALGSIDPTATKSNLESTDDLDIAYTSCAPGQVYTSESQVASMEKTHESLWTEQHPHGRYLSWTDAYERMLNKFGSQDVELVDAVVSENSCSDWDEDDTEHEWVQSCSCHGRCYFGACRCDPGYFGDNCEHEEGDYDCPTLTNGTVCSGNGLCDRKTGICHCDKAKMVSGPDCATFEPADDDEGLKACYPPCDPIHELCVDITCVEVNCPMNCSFPKGGVCVERNNGMFECECNDPFEGEGCQNDGTTTACSLSCNGNGLCHKHPSTGDETCLCSDEWDGDSCEIKRCPMNCFGNGECLQPNGTCVCKNNWGGRDCSVLLRCVDPDCSNHGNCENGLCICNEGWRGVVCDEPICKNDCSSPWGGECTAPGVCRCNRAFHGDDCGFKVCGEGSNAECNGHGRCTNEIPEHDPPVPETSVYWTRPVPVPVCVCQSGWLGDFCEVPSKNCPNNCTGHGECNRREGTCRCEEGWQGVDCSLRHLECNPPDCSGHGWCNNSVGECICYVHWTAEPDCSLYTPEEEPPEMVIYGTHNCSNHGIFVDGKCDCITGWEGVHCERLVLMCPDSCSGHGMCDEQIPRCECVEGWRGDSCNVGPEVVAQAVAKADVDPDLVDVVDEDIEALTPAQCCEKIIELGLECGDDCKEKLKKIAVEHNERLDDVLEEIKEPLYSKEQIEAFTPQECRTEIAKCCKLTGECPNTETWTETQLKEYLEEVAEQIPAPIVKTLDFLCCNNCSGHGVCREGFCECQKGFGGPCCDFLYPPCHNNCSGRGLCEVVRWETQSKCVCENGPYDAPGCGSPHDNPYDSGCPYQCSGHGYCRNGKCVCAESHGMSGEACNIALRCPSDCMGRGTCVGGKCNCNEGWSGEDCRFKIGEMQEVCPKSCCGRGECKYSHKKRKYYCACPSGTGGEDCCKNFCPNDCSWHGNCVRGVCDCDEGWEGIDCSKRPTLCPGHPKHRNYPSWAACWERGKCSVGKCICDESKFTCSKGTCQRTKQGYTGVMCQDMECPADCLAERTRTPGIAGTDLEYHGRCNVSTGVCDCGIRWKGDDCSLPLNIWEPFVPTTADRPVARSRHTALIRFDRQLVVYGGYTFRRCPIQRQYPCDFQLGDLWVFLFATMKWQPIKYTQTYDDVPRERAGHTAALVGKGEHLVIFGGTSNDVREQKGQVHKDTWLFNFDTGKWHRFPLIEPGALGRYDHSMFARRYTLLAMFGIGFDGYKKDAWVFDLHTELWTAVKQEGDIPPPRSRAATILFGDTIFVHGGLGSMGDVLFDTHTAHWKCGAGEPLKWKQLVLTQMPAPRYGASLIARGDVLYLYGGQSNMESRWLYKDDMWTYSFESGKWEEQRYWHFHKSGKPVGREGHISWFVPAPRPTKKVRWTYDIMFVHGGHYFSRRFQNRKFRDDSTRFNYLDDMWTYKVPRIENENENNTACSDCIDSYGELRECTVGASDADLKPAVEGIADEQLLIDPDERERDEEFVRSGLLHD